MEIKLVHKEGFTIAGVLKRNIPARECPMVWDELFEKANVSQLIALGNGMSFGMCHDMDEEGRLDYMAGFDYVEQPFTRNHGLDIFTVPAAQYAVVPLKGPVPECIHAGWKVVFEDYLPNHGLQHSGAPDFEVYGEGDLSDPENQMELWVPVIKR